MSTIASTQGASRISPVNEKLYHQSNLLGDWKGSFSNNNQAIEFKVVSITGDTAQIEYSHNGHKEVGTANVDKNTITYGNVTIATRDGQQGALEFSFGTVRQAAVIDKVATPAADQNPLVGSWIGSTETQSASFQVLSISRRDAQVRYTINGQSSTGVGDVVNNAVIFGKVLLSVADGLNGKLTFPGPGQTLSLDVTKFTPTTA
ncbi:MAG: hypothetical protein ACXWKP_28470 [Bradyrhizobium sp.]